MNSSYFGDSYDLVKKVLIDLVKNLGYTIAIDPMFTDNYEPYSIAFCKLVGVQHFENELVPSSNVCLFIDPDKGIKEIRSLEHVSYEDLQNKCEKGYGLLMVFDQSFSRSNSKNILVLMNQKLAILHRLGLFGLYYRSHANFIFLSKDERRITDVESALLQLGLPTDRIVKSV
jgi:hypothetical protein